MKYIHIYIILEYIPKYKILGSNCKQVFKAFSTFCQIAFQNFFPVSFLTSNIQDF